MHFPFTTNFMLNKAFVLSYDPEIFTDFARA